MITSLDKIQNATDFYLNPFYPLMVAIVKAEGGDDAFVKAIQCSLPVKAIEEALARGCKTIRNKAMSYPDSPITPCAKIRHDPWTQEPTPKCLVVTKEFIEYVAQTWAPIGANNDPTNLNANWVTNVKKIYAQLMDIPDETW